jgi:hypothetical protein
MAKFDHQDDRDFDKVVGGYPPHLVSNILTCRRSLFQNILLLFRGLSMVNRLLSTKIM